MERDINHVSSWILLPPGNRAILRFAADEMPEGSEFSLATATDLLAANLGHPYPWGHMPNGEDASKMWREQNIGRGGLDFTKWFITQDGRLGGAANVPRKLPGSLRSCLHYDGGQSHDMAGNEGYAVIRKVNEINRDIYRAVQMHAAEYVSADGGHITVSPIDPETHEVFIGFAGRCQDCPNPEKISFRQLQASAPEANFKLLPEFKGWSLVRSVDHGRRLPMAEL